MSPLTIFLAKCLGLYCVAVALAMAARKRDMLKMADELLRSPALTLLAAVIALGVGLAMVLGHNLWSGGALTIVVTLLGWSSLLKGLALLFFPSEQGSRFYRAVGYEKYFYLYVAGTLALGLYLTVAAFRA